MSEVNVLTLYQEYVNILSLLKGKPYEVKETTDIIVITLHEELSLPFLEEISKIINYFNYSLNPYMEQFEDVIEDIKRGSINIQNIQSLSINIEKEFSFKRINNIDYVFFDMSSAIESLKDIITEQSEYKLNIGIIGIDTIETELLYFVNIYNDFDESKIKKKRLDSEVNDQLEFYLSNNRKSNHTLVYNPYSFIIKGINGINQNNKLVQLIKTEYYYSMLNCLSDKLEDNSYVIRGEKNITLLNDKGFTTENYQTLIDVYLFLISQKKYTEKYIIIKKVITLYMNDKDNITVFDDKLRNIWKTINHYYNHYIEDNIKEFFKTKDQLLKEAMSASKVIYEQTDKVSNSVVASILSILIIIVTTIIRSLTNINTLYLLMSLVVFSTFSIVFYLITKNSSEKRYELTKDQFDHFINEISLIPNDEVKKIKKIYLLNPYEELKNSIGRLFWSLLVFNLVFLVSFIIYVFIKYNVISKINSIIHHFY